MRPRQTGTKVVARIAQWSARTAERNAVKGINLLSSVSPIDDKMHVCVEACIRSAFCKWKPDLPDTLGCDLPPCTHKSHIVRCRKTLLRSALCILEGWHLGKHSEPSFGHPVCKGGSW